VYAISGGKYGSEEKGTDPGTIPAPIPEVLAAYGGLLDFEDAPDSYYVGACSETQVTVMVASNYQPPIPPSPPPTPAPTTAPPVPTMTEDFRLSCRTAMIVGDSIERDDHMTAEEYVIFLSRLVPGGKVSVAQTFDSLPAVFQASFESLADGQEYIDVSGSKPNSEPTADQAANLESICQETNAAIFSLGNDGGGETPTSAPINTNATGSLDDDWILTDEAFATCKLSMMYSDLNRDNVLDANEYVRFVNRFINSTVATFASPMDLASLFITSFEELSTDGGIDVSGSKPAPSATDAQLEHLQAVCRATGKAVSLYQRDANNSTLPPVDAFLQDCIEALSVADRDSNGLMDQDEYLRFVNKLTGSTYTEFSVISDPLQLNYNSLSEESTAGVVNIEGATDGSLSSVELEQIQHVCSETLAALNQSIANQGNLDLLSEEEFQHCLNVLSTSDSNSNGWLEPIEFVEAVNLMTDQRFKGKAFADLDELFRVSYENAMGPNPYIDVSGAKSGDTATDAQLQNLKEVCVELLETVSVFEKPTDDELSSCLSLLKPIFSDDGKLSSDDYLWLVQKLSMQTWANATSISDLPFPVRDNYEWVKYGGNAIDMASVEGGAATVNITEELRWICERTIVAVESALNVIAESSGGLLDNCTIPMSFSDVNADNRLDRQEYRSFIDQLSAEAWKKEDYDSLDLAIQKLFNDYVDVSTESIPIEGSKPGDSPSDAEVKYLDSFCDQAESAIQSARANTLFHNSCAKLVRISDSNSDSMLAPDEYNHFLYSIAGQDAAGRAFDDLDSKLQSNYESFKPSPADPQVYLNSTSMIDNICEITKKSLPLLNATALVPPKSDNPASPNQPSSFGFLAIAGIAAGAASVLFSIVLVVCCCWTKRKAERANVNASINVLTKEQPECNPYADYDPEANVEHKTSSRSRADEKTEDFSERTSTEQFEDEPGSSPARHSTSAPHLNAMEDISSDHFDDEPVAFTVDQDQAPVYIDGDYGTLKGDEFLIDDDGPFKTGGRKGSPLGMDDRSFHACESAPTTFPEDGYLRNSWFEGISKGTSTTQSSLDETMSLEKVPSEKDEVPRDLPPENPFGLVLDPQLPSYLHDSSPQLSHSSSKVFASDAEVEDSALESPSPAVVPLPASRNASYAPPSPQRSPSTSSRPMPTIGRSASTDAQHNLGSPVKATDEIEGRHEGVAGDDSKQDEQSTPNLNCKSFVPVDESVFDQSSGKKPTTSRDEGSDGRADSDHESVSSDEESSATAESDSENESEPQDDEDESSSGAKTGTEEEDDDEDEEEDDDDDEEESDDEDSGSEAETIDDSLRQNNRLAVVASQQKFYDEIKLLVAQLMPDDLENVDVMIGQFAGNEGELLKTLQNMAVSGSATGEAEHDGSEKENEMEVDSSESRTSDDDASEEGSSDGDGEEESSDEEKTGSNDKEMAASETDEQRESDDEESESEMAAPSERGEADSEESDSQSDDEESESEMAAPSERGEVDSEESDSDKDSHGSAEREHVEEESMYEEESYYSEEVVESDEETVDDEQESIESDQEEEESEDSSSSYESETD
jgi:hypothetical protein